MKTTKNVITSSIKSFIKQEALGGILLIIATFIAMIWANSSWSDLYHHVWHEIDISIGFGDFNMTGNFHHWVNDGLMAIFFFTIGLEVKREIIGGELSTVKKAILPISAAVGGMLIPALFYVIINWNQPEYINGWGIPMATDIAFALGLLAMLGKRVPISLKIFLTALAIADDIGAVLVIAIFYTESIDFTELINAIIFLSILIAGNYFGVRRTSFYAVIGLLGVWIAFMYSGVHATIAGVLIALTIPANAKIDENTFIEKLKDKLDKFQQKKPNQVSLLSKDQAHLIEEIDEISEDAHTPLQKLEHSLHPITALIILPIFALANAGIHIEESITEFIFHPISMGIIVGLVLGKLLGISLFAFILTKSKWVELPEGVTFSHIIGVGFMAGIGFTMSIFISDMAFIDEQNTQIAKIGIFIASIISAILGMLIISRASRN